MEEKDKEIILRMEMLFQAVDNNLCSKETAWNELVKIYKQLNPVDLTPFYTKSK